MPAPSPRRAAAEVLIAVLDDGRPLDEALARTPGFAALEGRDRGFARAIVSASLRRLGGLDAVLAQFIERPLPETARLARALLRTGACQLLVLDTPPHAAVSETVTLARADRDAKKFAKLINAVLRGVDREGRDAFAALPPGADLPQWLIDRWRAAYGKAANDIALALREEPPLDLTVKADPEAWAEKLGGQSLPTGTVRLPPGAHAVETLPGFEDGAWWVQDAAAALPARLLLSGFDDLAGKRVLDLCAAPGGKTLQLCAAGAEVTAVDKSARRLRRLEENLARTGLAAELVEADALAFEAAAPFEAVLLDAPCSATGTLRRRPDVAWSKSPKDVVALAKIQAELIAAAAALVKPGGRLVFCTCSLEPEEGPGALEAGLALAKTAGVELTFDPPTAAEISALGLPLEALVHDAVRTLPSFWSDFGGMDGFYIARLARADS
jgi:16S rRNA (cytosine967-C5)-methyltransferase